MRWGGGFELEVDNILTLSAVLITVIVDGAFDESILESDGAG